MVVIGVITLDLSINNSVFTIDSMEACDSVEWNGNIYGTSGIYVDTLQTLSGCDSIVTMDLTIHNRYLQMTVWNHVMCRMEWKYV